LNLDFIASLFSYRDFGLKMGQYEPKLSNYKWQKVNTVKSKSTES